MAVLFQIEDKLVVPNTETLLINPFKKIWNRDKKKSKEDAIEDFTYIEFMSSMRRTNPYRLYPEDKKHDVISQDIIKRKSWKPDPLIIEAISFIHKLQKEGSTSYSYYKSAKLAAEKMQNFFNTVDITEVNPKSGNPIYKPRDITSALNDTSKVLENLNILQKKVEEELYEESRSKAGKKISPFADPESLL